MIKVLFFGPVAERIGTNALQAEHRPGIRLQDVRDELAAQYPQAFEIVCFAAANGEHVRDLSLPLADNSEVAFMARFSGG
ncbi:MAG: MoaD/ThiS family protein [Gallionella sp.]|nr:MoaD/ThiS family protein [Gallionella sp.]